MCAQESIFPHDFAVPANNHQDYIACSIRDLTTAIQHRYLHTPLQPVGDKQFAAIQSLQNIFFLDITHQTTPAPIHPTVEHPEAVIPPQQIE